MSVPDSGDHARASEYLDYLAVLPWCRRMRAFRPVDPAHVRKALDRTHDALDAEKEKLLDALAAFSLRPGPRVPAVCLAGPRGSGKTTLALSLVAGLDRRCAHVDCAHIADAAAVLGAPERRAGVIIYGIRRVGSVDAVILLDGIDRLDGGRGAPSVLVEVLGAGGRRPGFRDRCLGFGFDLSAVLIVRHGGGRRPRGPGVAGAVSRW